VAKGFANDFRRFFVRGLVAVLPPLVTVAIIVYLVRVAQTWVGDYINTGIILLLDPVLPQDKDQLRNIWKQYWILQGVGFILAIIAIYFIGRFAGSFIIRGVRALLEQTLAQTPVVRQIYPSVKQVTDFLFSERKVGFSRVVAVEYPRKGIWSVGFATGPGMKSLVEALGSDVLTCFVPSSPTPVTGYVITVFRDEVIDLPMTIDEALRLVISCGVLIPSSERLTGEQARPVLEAAAQTGGGQATAAGNQQEKTS
jgi:uncharacterized membrane protein